MHGHFIILGEKPRVHRTKDDHSQQITEVKIEVYFFKQKHYQNNAKVTARSRSHAELTYES